MKRFYVVTANGKVSQESYVDFNEAVRFITRRSDKPEMVNRCKYKSRDCVYEIHEVMVKGG